MNRIIQLTFSFTPSFHAEDTHVIGFFAEDRLEEAKQAARNYLQTEVNQPAYYSTDEGDVPPDADLIEERKREYCVSLGWRPLGGVNLQIQEIGRISLGIEWFED